MTHIDRNNILVHVGEYCEVVSLTTAVQTVVEQQILSVVPDVRLLNAWKYFGKSDDAHYAHMLIWTLCILENLNCLFVRGHCHGIICSRP